MKNSLFSFALAGFVLLLISACEKLDVAPAGQTGNDAATQSLEQFQEEEPAVIYLVQPTDDFETTTPPPPASDKPLIR
jgi:hypothetical protein